MPTTQPVESSWTLVLLADIYGKGLTVRLRLVSDFHDYYDQWFDRGGPEFRRMTTEGPSRPEMLYDEMDARGVKCLGYGLVKNVARFLTFYPAILEENLTNEFLSSLRLVVYLDEMAHRGEGKMIMNALDAVEKYPDHFCTEYRADSALATSFRYLQIGKRAWWLRYWSTDDWRSNCGDVHIDLLTEATDLYALPYPLYAIDFIPTFDGLRACDLNIAPGLKGTGMEDVLKPKEVYDLIEEAVHLQEGR
jgi:hypothetical protein